jgi:hypothetical protein
MAPQHHALNREALAQELAFLLRPREQAKTIQVVEHHPVDEDAEDVEAEPVAAPSPAYGVAAPPGPRP